MTREIAYRELHVGNRRFKLLDAGTLPNDLLPLFGQQRPNVFFFLDVLPGAGYLLFDAQIGKLNRSIPADHLALIEALAVALCDAFREFHSPCFLAGVFFRK
ncbi:MAG: hypothetical protein EOP36_03070 [Rubrivivax sp.]|nr:MAG: hypothetical protein EOP36_03070 [Rubrivivax sp.]